MIEKESSDAEALSEEFLDEYFLDADLTPERLAQLTLDEKRELYQFSERIDIDENEVEVFLLQCGFPQEILDGMKLGVKFTIYESLKEYGSNAEFFGHDDIEIPFPTSNTQNAIASNDGENHPNGTISDSYLTLSVSSVFVNGNNLNRYLLYPSFEWTGVTNLNYDTFAYALHANYWKLLRTGELDIYWSGSLLRTLDPTRMDFTAKVYKMRENDLSLPYYGVASIAARPLISTMHNQIMLGYAQDFYNNLGVNIGAFSISFSGGTNTKYARLTFDKGY